MPSNKFVKMIGAAGIVTASVLVSISTDAVDVHAEKPVISNPSPLYEQKPAPIVKPIWSMPLAKFKLHEGYNSASSVALAEEGRIFTLVTGGQLAAYDGSNGHRLWKYGSDLQPYLVYDKSMLYGFTKDGALFAVTANGEKKWTTKLTATAQDHINLTSDTIYVTHHSTLFALDRETGKLRWKVTEPSKYYFQGGNIVVESTGIVLRDYLVEGTHTSGMLVAYDKLTGKRLWERDGIWDPLAVKDGLVYSLMDMFMLESEDANNNQVDIAVIDLKTGEFKEHRVYKWAKPPFEERSIYSATPAFVDGNDLYINQDLYVAKFSLSSYTPDGKPAQRWRVPDLRSFQSLNRVHEGRLLYYNHYDQSILLMKTANGGQVWFPPGGQPPVQTDLYGNSLLVARADGTLDAYNYSTLQPMISVKTGSRDFEPTLKSGNMIFIRSGGTLHAVKLPTG